MVQGSGIWRGPLFQTTEVTFGVQQCDLLKDINVPPRVPCDLSRVNKFTERSCCSVVSFWNVYGAYGDGTLHRYFNK